MLRFLAISLLLACTWVQPALAARALPTPRLLAVYVKANWCPACKILSPQLAAARTSAKLDTRDILFVELNLSNKITIHQAILQAQALGIGAFLQAQGSSTGYVALLDAKSKQELARFDQHSSSATIAETITRHLH